MADFDFLVVGAGSAGCVLASRLASFARVGLIEAGGCRTTGLVRRPSDYIKLFGSESDWNWETVPQRNLAGRRLRFPRGRGIGGSTRINASIWLEPEETCLQQLAAATGGVLSSEQLSAAVQETRAIVAPERPRWLSQTAQRFLQAADQLKLKANAYLRMNAGGVRRTAFDAFCDRSKTENAGLTILSDTLIDRVILQDGRAVGLSCTSQKSQDESYQSTAGKFELHANKGVIMCGGAIASPTILQRSGIGCRERLRELGIECQVDLPGVGQALRDHLIFPIIFRTIASAAFPIAWSPRQLARWQCVGTGPIASNLAEAGLFYGNDDTKIQLLVTPTDYLRHPNLSQPSMTIGVTLSHPRSVGEVHIVSAQPGDSPHIDPGYLSDESDLENMFSGVELAGQLAETSSLGSWVGEQVVPGDRDCEKSIRRFSQTLYHPVGGCCLGTVLSGDFRVRGVEGLWVVDASTLPFMPAANPNALVIALAWAVGDGLRKC